MIQDQLLPNKLLEEATLNNQFSWFGKEQIVKLEKAYVTLLTSFRDYSSALMDPTHLVMKGVKKDKTGT